MVVTRLDILKHVLTALESGKYGQKLLIDHIISLVRNIPNDTY